jgi:hypothetical protein
VAKTTRRPDRRGRNHGAGRSCADCRGGQPEQDQKSGEFGQHDGLAAAVDPAVEKRPDGVGHLELLRRVAGGERVTLGGRAGRRGGRLPGWSAAAGYACRGRAAGRGEQRCQRHGRGQQSQSLAAGDGRGRLDHGVLLAVRMVIPPVTPASGFPAAIYR